MGARLKTFASYVLPMVIVWGVLQTAYELGYYRGHRDGAVAMRNAIMCVLERTANLKPQNYCDKLEAKL